MSVNDVKIRSSSAPLWTIEFVVASGAANTIHAGEPTIKGEATATSTGAVLVVADGDPLPTSTHQFSGLAKSESTDTASAAGVVTCWAPLPGIVYSAKTKLSTDANTAAKINAMKDKRSVFDKTGGGVITVDAGATDTATSGLGIVGGDFRTQEIFFIVIPGATLWSAIAAT